MTWTLESDKRTLPAVIQAARRAVEQQPENALAWQRLGEAQLMLGACTAAIASLSAAHRLRPESKRISLLLVSAHKRAGDFETALDILDRYLVERPDDDSARIDLFEILVAARKWDAARGLVPVIERLCPSNPCLLDCAARWARKNGLWRELLRVCQASLESHPAHTGARYYRSLAMAGLSLPEAASSMDLYSFVWVGELATPPEFSDGSALRAGVKSEILRNPTLRRDPRGKTTRDGFQTTCLEQPDSIATTALLRQIRTAIEGYVSRIDTTSDPFSTFRPARVRLDSWAVVYTDSGKQNPHFHKDGWISGTYYVAAPKNCEGSRDGALLLGVIPGSDNADPPWGTRVLSPVPGRVVLFPSWIPHATEPTHAEEQRICVAFDVVPVSL